MRSFFFRREHAVFAVSITGLALPGSRSSFLMKRANGGTCCGVMRPDITVIDPVASTEPVFISVPMLVFTKSPMKHPTFVSPVSTMPPGR